MNFIVVPDADEFLQNNSHLGKLGQLTYDYNCWGFVAGFYGWLKQYDWIDEEQISELLSTYCTEVERENLQPGDIIAVYRDRWISHTMLYKGGVDFMITHKAGAWWLETIPWEYYETRYDYGVSMRYFRPKQV